MRMVAANVPSIMVTFASVRRVRFPSARPVRPFAAARLNMTTVVAASTSVRLRPSLNLGFATSDVESIREVQGADGSSRYEITTNFLSLYGSVSPLPIFAFTFTWSAS